MVKDALVLLTDFDVEFEESRASFLAAGSEKQLNKC
ncbi:MAG: hypothetical protein ACI9E4_000471 [Pseudohongiellaceae bacterium]|jgi:hypothetical protein